MQKRFIHIVARSIHGFFPFQNRLHCIWMWKKLTESYSNIYAAVLMPNHLHLLVETISPKEDQLKMSRMISRLSYIFYSGKTVWQSVPAPDLIPDRLHLQRSIRYVHLNPCRKKLIDDPLKWEFSTHRDWLGLSYPAMIQESSKRSAFRTFSRAQFHSYISSDPSCKVVGTTLPEGLRHHQPLTIKLSETPLKWILNSVLISQHEPRESLRNRGLARTVALHIAAESEQFYQTEMSQELGCTRQAIYKLLKKPRNIEAIIAAKHTLSDQRLHCIPLEVVTNVNFTPTCSGIPLRS